ncbi:AMOP domain protein [Ostertagia ostertagi]
MMIYPNIVNMLGEMTVDVNALCLDRSQTYILMIEEREVASCYVLNAAIARCNLPKIYDWGTKTVYFQPQSKGANDEKAFVGYIYFVPPTLDPQRLDIGSIYEWYKNPMPNYIKKFRPEHRTLARLATYTNRNSYEYRWKPQEEVINLNQVQQWYMDDWERWNTLYTYRVGYLKLAPIRPNDQNGTELLSGTIKADSLQSGGALKQLVPLQPLPAFRRQETVAQLGQSHLLWRIGDPRRFRCIGSGLQKIIASARPPTRSKSGMSGPSSSQRNRRKCAMTETFRDITCTTVIGSKNCYMSAQNIYGSYARQRKHFRQYGHLVTRFMTHYGQVCCYDEAGFLMQTPYQPVIKTQKEYFYNPGYPLRAYEFGTPPYMGQFEGPGLSVFHNDYMPYFLCCKFADFRCQMFYWRRPSSACQEYQPPATGQVSGAGVFNTIDNDKFIFNEPGVCTTSVCSETVRSPEVRVQVRMEQYPNRKVIDCSHTTSEITLPIFVVSVQLSGTCACVLCLIVEQPVERGQPEIYVVLEEAQIGIRVRESYALDIDRLPMYQESMGMLDVPISVPPQYGVRPRCDKTREAEQRQRYELPRISGLMRPFPEQNNAAVMQGLTLNDVNSETYRQQIINNCTRDE